MEAYTYTNLFDTKGIEYIIIIFFLLLLIPFRIIVNRQSEAVIKWRQTIQAFTAAVLRIPQGLFFSRNHTWLQLEKSGEARIGIDDFLLKVLGNVTIKPIVYPGEKVKKGEVIALVEQAGKQLKLLSPVSGRVSDLNYDLDEDSVGWADDPYGEGWLFTVQPDNWKTETAGFLLGKETQSWMESEVQRLKDFLSVSFSRYADPAMALAFQEGGELQINPLEGMEAVVWDDFQNEFLEKME
jgi:glycine cleavage system H protein